MVVASSWWHHGMHHQRGSVGGAALHPREELWLHQGGGGARGSGRGRGNPESEGIATLDPHHCSGKPILTKICICVIRVVSSSSSSAAL